MSKKTLLILIIIIVFVGAIGFFALLNQNPIPRIEPLETPSDGFVPFSQSGDFGAGQDGVGVSGNTPFTPPRIQTFFDVIADDSRLIQITNSPVAGYTVFSKIVEIIEELSGPEESIVDTFNFFEYPTLTIGDQGPGVQALQTVLNRVFPNETIPVDGNFTTDTKNAVIAFQTANNLGSDGVVGNLTKARLNQFQGLSTNPQDFEPIVRQEEYLTVRYQEQVGGLVYDLGIDTRDFVQVTSNSFPAIYESFFGNNGESIVVRYSSDGEISTFVGDIGDVEQFVNPETNEIEFVPGVVDGEFFAPDIPFVSVNPNGSELLFFQRTQRGSEGFIFNFETKDTQRVFSSSFWEWLPDFYGPEQFSLTTRASALASGYSYRYDASEFNEFTPGIGSLPGLTTNYNPSGSKVLYSIANGRFIETYVYDFNDRSTLSLGINTLAEKCVWRDVDIVLCAVPQFIGPEDYPDAWYKGEVRFDDRMWEINTENGREEIISTLSNDTVQLIEAVDLYYANNILLFKNRYDHTLWMLDLR